MEVSGQLHTLAALHLGIGGWVGFRSGLDAMEKRTVYYVQSMKIERNCIR
jgi:hypothetical protein